MFFQVEFVESSEMKYYCLLLFVTFSTTNFKCCLSKDLQLLILHNNDMHARFEETSERSGKCQEEDKKHRKCVGGFARVAHVIRQARKEAKEGKGPEVLFLNAGDTYTGTLWFHIHKWKIAVDFLNLLQPDAVSLGNHEFDDGPLGLYPYIKANNFSILAANLDFSQEPTLRTANVSKSVVLEVSGTKIGVIGYLTPETAHISASGLVIFKDEMESIREESERLDKQGVKIIIAVGHSGFDIDVKIAMEVPLVDLVIGGHTNTFLWNGPKPNLEEPENVYPTVVEQSSGKKVPVVQAYAYTKYLGQLNITFDGKGNAIKYWGQPLLLDSTIPEDQDVLHLLSKYRPPVNALDTVVGKSLVVLDGSVQSCRYKECNFGNMIADAFVAYRAFYHRGPYWTDAPIGIINGGAIRNTVELKKAGGNITRGDLIGALPFDDSVITISLSGTDLLNTLEIGARSNGETSRGELLQVSGIRYRIDLSKPVGSRIVEAKARCGLCSVPIYEPILHNKTYRVVTTGYLNNGGDGHKIIMEKGYSKFVEPLSDVNMVAWYMESRAVYPEEDERLVIIGTHSRKRLRPRKGQWL